MNDFTVNSVLSKFTFEIIHNLSMEEERFLYFAVSFASSILPAPYHYAFTNQRVRDEFVELCAKFGIEGLVFRRNGIIVRSDVDYAKCILIFS